MNERTWCFMVRLWVWLLRLTLGLSSRDRCDCKGNESCAEAAVRPWSQSFISRRCELWCCSEALGRALGWSRLAEYRSRQSNRAVWEPMLGSWSLASFTDGSVTQADGRAAVKMAPLSVLPSGREAVVLTLRWSMYRQPNLTQAIEACVAAADSLDRPRGCLLMAIGDAPFPPLGFKWPTFKAHAWATNVAPDANLKLVAPMPLGVSAGPNRAWARTIRSHLSDGKDAAFRQRHSLLLCRGYRADPSRLAALNALAEAGFDKCSATDRANVAEYWRRLQEAKTTFCPSGYGTATFRVYEALLAGSVPVLEVYQKHADLYADLPVILVPRFNLLSPSDLNRRWRAIIEKRAALDLRRIFAPFWLAKLARETTEEGLLVAAGLYPTPQNSQH